MAPNHYQQFLDQHQAQQAQQYEEQMKLYQTQYAEHQRIQQQYYQMYEAQQAQPVATVPAPGQTGPTANPAASYAATTQPHQQQPASTHPAKQTPPLPTPPMPPTPPAPPTPSHPVPKPSPEQPIGRGGWFARAVALQAACELGMHSRIDHLCGANRAYSTTFKAQVEHHKTQIRKWGQDPMYDF